MKKVSSLGAVELLEALSVASQNADRAIEASFSEELSSYPEIERQTWAAASIIHCDTLRYLVAYQTSTNLGIVRLLWAGDIVCTLFEARKWFFNTGNQNLARIADQNGYGASRLREQVKFLKSAFPLGEIDAFESFRNKAGHHYDADFVECVRAFSQTEFEAFHRVLDTYVRYAHEWIKLCAVVVKHGYAPPTPSM